MDRINEVLMETRNKMNTRSTLLDLSPPAGGNMDRSSNFVYVLLDMLLYNHPLLIVSGLKLMNMFFSRDDIFLRFMLSSQATSINAKPLIILSPTFYSFSIVDHLRCSSSELFFIR